MRPFNHPKGGEKAKKKELGWGKKNEFSHNHKEVKP
jgi:hypothetical protein